MKVCPLFSGSSGNATLVASGSTRVLVDCGVSCSALQRELAKVDVELRDVDAILITHAHDDHVKGLNVVAKRCDAPVYASIGTWTELQSRGKAESVAKKNARIFHSLDASPLVLGDLQAKYFSTPHDADDSVGYVLEDDHSSFGFATDLGRVTPAVRKALLQCDVVLLEANYDEKMLECGPYPYPLKQRIRSPYGHLSNVDSGKFAATLVESGVGQLFLGHLSAHNNTIELAYKTVAKELTQAGVNPKSDCAIYMTRRMEASRTLEF
jgi:phosphoribosyl 1,2-cyclic phosphodiesterase